MSFHLSLQCLSFQGWPRVRGWDHRLSL